MSEDTAVATPITDSTKHMTDHILGPVGAPLLVLPMRFVITWMFFSAAWRRLVLDGGKMDPTSAAWIGQKINNFYPHALLIKPLLGWLISDINRLDVFMWLFTFIEFAVGVGVAFGLFSRLAAFGSVLLSFFMLLGAGWLGATCLDEWQIGCWGIAGGFVVMIAGGGKLSLDSLIGRRFPRWTRGGLAWITSGRVLERRGATVFVSAATVITVFLMLWTNQAFVGGLWGPLANPSAKPSIKVSEVTGSGTSLKLTVFRDGGPDTYGAFVTQLTVLDSSCNAITTVSDSDLAKIAKAGEIANAYPAHVAAGPDGFTVPLGALGTMTLDMGTSVDQVAVVQLRDVSGTWWASSKTCATPKAGS